MISGVQQVQLHVAIGNNVAEHLAAFEQEKAGMGDITLFNSIHKGQLPVAEVKLSNEQLIRVTGLPNRSSRTTLLSCVAAKEAWDDAGIGDMKQFRTGFISANSVGGMDKSEDFFIEFVADSNKGKLRNVFDHECGSMTEIVADKLGIKDFITTLSTACSSSANAIFYAARLIRNGVIDVAIAGGAENIEIGRASCRERVLTDV